VDPIVQEAASRLAQKRVGAGGDSGRWSSSPPRFSDFPFLYAKEFPGQPRTDIHGHMVQGHMCVDYLGTKAAIPLGLASIANISAASAIIVVRAKSFSIMSFCLSSRSAFSISRN